jgi:hypothetical protein
MPANRKLEAPKFLAGWKEIANYLGKGVRTVQRYEREMGLPVRRPAKKSRAAVVATRAEIDGWVAASPIGQDFRLPQLAGDHKTFIKQVTTGLAQMRRLRDQMTELRSEVTRTVTLLKGTVELAQKRVHHPDGVGRIISVAEVDLREEAVFEFIETRPDGKTN